MNKCALYAGTFEFFHKGHIDILCQASQIFDQVYLAVSINPYKNSSPLEDRFNYVSNIVAKLDLKNVVVVKNYGYGYLCAKIYQCDFLIRGIRNLTDADYEINLAAQNSLYCPSIRTIFISASYDLRAYSSTNLKKLKNNEPKS